MILVLDASAAVEVVLRRAGACKLEQRLCDADWVIAPTLFAAEAANAFWKYHRFEDLPLEQCERALDQALSLPDDLLDDRELAREAFALACLARVTAYDALYMVLARRHNARLLTMDQALRRACRKHSISAAG